MAEDGAIERVGALEDPVRRGIYRFVRAAGYPVTRDEVAAGVEISRGLAAFHLDKLVARGLLSFSFLPSGPTGGRPAKAYEPVAEEIRVSFPERRYDLAGEVLVDAVAAGGARARRAALAAAREQGRRLAGSPARRSVAAVRSVLDELGYEPRVQAGALVLGNCPFHALAERDRPLVCGLNLELVGGILDAAGPDRCEAVLEPGPGRCCVAVRRADRETPRIR